MYATLDCETAHTLGRKRHAVRVYVLSARTTHGLHYHCEMETNVRLFVDTELAA